VIEENYKKTIYCTNYNKINASDYASAKLMGYDVYKCRNVELRNLVYQDSLNVRGNLTPKVMSYIY